MVLQFLNSLVKEEAMKDKKKKEEEEKVIKRMEEIQKSAQAVAPVAHIRTVAPKPRPVQKRHVGVVKKNPAAPMASKAPEAASTAALPGSSTGPSKPASGASPANALGLLSGYDSSDSDN